MGWEKINENEKFTTAKPNKNYIQYKKKQNRNVICL